MELANNHLFHIDWNNKTMKTSINSYNNINRLKQDIYCALKTERFTYPIFDTEYGSEFHILNSRNLPRELYLEEVERMTKEVIEGIKGVIRVKEISIEIINLVTLRIKVSIETEFGQISNLIVSVGGENG